RTTQDEALGLASCHEHTAQPSMNWALDACSLDRLGQASAEMPGFGPHPTLAEQALTSNLSRLRRLIRLGPGDFEDRGTR
ncbi:hypothetical protein, partial [Sphaerotilus sp.]|uniref:hypothetical protein n=1 Tax=Sphaerotilus sp. TaxID=2093942 RepID=UPI0034E2171F